MTRRLTQQLKDFVWTMRRPVNLITSPAVVEKPEGERVVVFSPHFDDDVIGCGGTLCKHVAAGNRVAILYFTDGREGDPSVADKGEVERLRKAEARRATALLEIDDLIFLDEPETRLKPSRRLARKLAEILNEVKPDLLYVPSFLENHIDHLEANRVLLSVAEHVAPHCTIAAYEVWTPLIPNVIVDISTVIAKKEQALRQYETQIRQVDYVSTTIALNRYRSVLNLWGRGYAEAFLVVSSREYIGLVKRLMRPGRGFILRV